MQRSGISERPNIVYVFADDMGYGDLSCLNPDSKIRTVHMDAAAARGMVFRDAHSSSAVCTPARYSVLTGRYCWRSTLKKGVNYGYDTHLIERGRMTVASYLKGKGYATGCVGKWHLGMDWALNSGDPTDVDFSKPIENGPVDFGFDYFFGISASLDMPPYVYIENDRATALPDRITVDEGDKTFWREGPTAPDFRHEEVLPKCAEKAEAFIDLHAGEPFFLYFPLPAPHTPILPTPEFRGKSGTNEYGDFVLQVDHVVGLITAALERNGISESTVLVVSSDNGCSPKAGFEELARVGHNPSHIFRGHKADIYEGGHRIPLIVSWPGTIREGSMCDETVCLSDLLATCADLSGDTLPDDAGEDSVSNLPLWLEESRDRPVREATVHHSIDGSFSIRRGRWKLEMCPGSGGWSHPRPGKECEGPPPIQLYDLDADIGERGNVYAKYPREVEDLTALLTAYVRDGRSTPGSPQPNTGARHWPQLNWLLEEDL